MTSKITLHTGVTMADIMDLRSKAALAGDDGTAALCSRALGYGGDQGAWDECKRIIGAGRGRRGGRLDDLGQPMPGER